MRTLGPVVMPSGRAKERVAAWANIRPFGVPAPAGPGDPELRFAPWPAAAAIGKYPGNDGGLTDTFLAAPGTWCQPYPRAQLQWQLPELALARCGRRGGPAAAWGLLPLKHRHPGAI